MKKAALFVSIFLPLLFFVTGCDSTPGPQRRENLQTTITASISPDSLPVIHNVDSLFEIFARTTDRKHLQAANVLNHHIYKSGHVYTDTIFNKNTPASVCDAYTYGAMALYKLDHGDYASAISFNKQSLELYRILNDSLHMVYKLQNLYVNYSLTGQYEKALSCLDESLEIAKTIGNEPMIANTLLCIGDLHHRNGHNEIAVEYFEKGYDMYSQQENVKRIVTSLVGLATTYRELGKTEDAYRYALEADSLSREKGDDFSRIESLGTLATVYQKMENWNIALKCLEEDRMICEQHGLKSSLANVLCWIGEVYFKSGKSPSKAEEYLKYSIAISEEINKPDALNEAYEYLYKLYKANHNVTSALDCLEKSVELKDSIYKEDTREQLNNFHIRYETQEKEYRIKMQDKDINRHKTINKFILCIGILTVLVLIFLFYASRQRNKRKRQFAENRIRQLEQEKQFLATQAVLDGETQERTRLARDLHDGLGSMLTGVKLNLENMKTSILIEQANTICFDNALSILDESMRELRRVAHHLMPETLSRYGLKPAIGDFCRSLSSHIVFDWFGNEKRLDPKLEVVIYRIVHELVNNALKYAGAFQIIIVQVMQEDKRIALTVQDDGCGFNPATVTRGMGLSNIRTRVASFGGNIQIHSKSGKGTEINVEFIITY